jgi:hypothetical protein
VVGRGKFEVELDMEESTSFDKAVEGLFNTAVMIDP